MLFVFLEANILLLFFEQYKTTMSSLLKQIKRRRLTLGFKQSDMQDRIGILRQVYHRLESKGNPRLATLELVATGLNSELVLVPLDKISAVKALLNKTDVSQPETVKDSENLEDDPWKGILEDDS